MKKEENMEKENMKKELKKIDIEKNLNILFRDANHLHIFPIKNKNIIEIEIEYNIRWKKGRINWLIENTIKIKEINKNKIKVIIENDDDYFMKKLYKKIVDERKYIFYENFMKKPI